MLEWNSGCRWRRWDISNVWHYRSRMDNIIKRLSTLLSVKSLVTLALTAVFAYMACTNQISQDFMTIYAVIIAFYFGTQSQKVQNALDGEG